MLSRVFLVIGDSRLRLRIRELLSKSDCLVETIKRKKRLWERLSQESGDLIVAARSLIPEPAAETIRLLRTVPDSPDVVVLTEDESPAEEAGLLAAGCKAVLPVAMDSELLREVLENILAERREAQQQKLKSGKAWGEPRLSDFESTSPAMQAFMSVAERVASSDTSLLLLGETGVGKERLARAIHAESPRGQGPFVAVNCGALPESLLESELFGHEEGAFTGASRARRGMFELAHGGTIFLDEIGDMALHLQVKLLRALQEHEIQRIGAERVIQVDVRIMAATNRDLAAEVEEKNFRRDLFYRLGVITLTLPPLRERREDICPLVTNFVDYFASNLGVDVEGITPRALKSLQGYAWPGNVRELANVIERAVLLCSESRITTADLPLSITGVNPPAPFSSTTSDGGFLLEEGWIEKPLKDLREAVFSRVEAAYLQAVLKETRGRVGEAAKRAGITSRSLFDKMHRYGLRKEDFKSP
jgi:DNA-binding NtrC family response regulator